MALWIFLTSVVEILPLEAEKNSYLLISSVCSYQCGGF